MQVIMIVLSVTIFFLSVMLFLIYRRMSSLAALNNRIKTHLLYIYHLYPQKKIQYMNDFCEDLFGYKASEFIGSSSFMDTLVYKDDWPVFEFMLKYPELSNRPLVMRMVKKDGSVIWTEHRYSPVKNAIGQIIYVEGVVKDITEDKLKEISLRESEEKFRELFDNANDLLFLLKFNSMNERYEIIDFNKTARQKIYADRHEIIGSDILRYIKLDYAPIFKSSMTETIEKEHASFEMFMRSNDGSQVLVDVNTSFFRLNNERVILLVCRDITEKRKVEYEMEKTQKLESLGILSGGIAHDFNNLLTAILGNISLIRIQLNDNSDLLNNLCETEQVVYKARDLTQQLLSFSKGFSLVKVVGDIGKLIKENALFISRGTGMKCDILMEDNAYIAEYDEGQIVQVVNNIVINASQAMRSGGILKITAELKELKKDNYLKLLPGEYIVIHFKDNGRGIFPEDLQKIFDPFYTTKANGTGLGLSSSYSIIRKHNGKITVDSEIGHGACFTIYIPSASHDKKSLYLSEGKEESKDEIVKGSGRLLVMDDNEDIIGMAKTMLTYLGYIVDPATDGETALLLYKKMLEAGTPYDLVILDLTIQGGMGGRETLENLLTIDPNVKAVVSSGYSDDDVMTDYKKYGFSGCITKPYTVGVLSKTLNELVSK